MLATLTRDVTLNNIDVDRVGDVVWFTADELGDLSVLAAPLAGWWQQHGPSVAGGVALRFVGPDGVTELTYSKPELAVEQVQRHINVDSGQLYGPGEAPGPIRRLTAALLRRTRNGFTASELLIRDEGSLLCVALAGRDLDDRPRSLEFQAFNPAHDDYDPDDDDGYCLVTEHHVPVVQGLVALRLTPRSYAYIWPTERPEPGEYAPRSTRSRFTSKTTRSNNFACSYVVSSPSAAIDYPYRNSNSGKTAITHSRSCRESCRLRRRSRATAETTGSCP